MPATRRTPAVTVLALAACLTAATLTGCAGKDDEPRTPAAADTPTTSAPASPTPTPTPTPTGTPTSAEPAALVDRLLPASAVPGLHAEWTWTDGDSEPTIDRPSDVCAVASLVDIGATEVISKSYLPPDDSDDNAQQQVARFPDAKTAAGAWSVLGSWHDKCRRQVAGLTGAKVTPFTPVTVGAGQARWYLVSGTAPGEEAGRFYAIGMVRNGTLITVMHMFSTGQDYDYPPGKEPMVGRVRAAARLTVAP